MRGFCGCGSSWMPSSPGAHTVDISIWKPCYKGLDNIYGKKFLHGRSNSIQ